MSAIRKIRKDKGQKRTDYVKKVPDGYYSLVKSLSARKKKCFIDPAEYDFFMSQKCQLCGSPESVTVLPLEGDLTIHTAVPVCKKCCQLSQPIGVQRFLIHSHKVVSHSKHEQA